MKRSIPAAVAVCVALSGLIPSPATASSVPPPPGIGPTLCDGLTGTCTNTIFIRPVVFYADRFSPTKGEFPVPHPKVWSLGQLKVAAPQDVFFGIETMEVFARGVLRVRPFSMGFVSVATVAVGQFVRNIDPLRPYRFEGFAISHDPDALRGQDFEFVGEQTAPIPDAPD